MSLPHEDPVEMKKLAESHVESWSTPELRRLIDRAVLAAKREKKHKRR